MLLYNSMVSGNGRVLVESNAILDYLAEDSAYLPSDPYERAQALGWQCWLARVVAQPGHIPMDRA